MKIKVWCCNCKEEILQTDSNLLATPLVGAMFTLKEKMEWDRFAPSATGNDLVCPLCSWVFHLNGLIRTVVGTPGLEDVFQEKPEDLIETLKYYNPRKRKTEMPPAHIIKDPPNTDDGKGASAIEDIESMVEGSAGEEKGNSGPDVKNDAGEFTPDAPEDAEEKGDAPPGTVAAVPQNANLDKKQAKVKAQLAGKSKK